MTCQYNTSVAHVIVLGPLLLMEEILQELIGSLSFFPLLTGLECTSQVGFSMFFPDF